MINGDKRSESVTEWLTMASCNCVCLTALTCIINYQQQWTDEKELEATRSRFYYWDWQRKQAIPSVLCVDSGSQHIECECIFHDRALGLREREGQWIKENLCFFCDVHTETQQCYHKRNVCLAFCVLCDCVRVWVHTIIKTAFVWPLCACVGVQY